MKKILVGLSGWVDSAVTAYLLQQKWYQIHAWFMRNYVSNSKHCQTKEDWEMALKVAKFLNIDFHIFDFQEEYEKEVVEYIYQWYKEWITPNPDIICNNKIKFNMFLEKAIENWFDRIATWHYAQIQKDNEGTFHLLKSKDKTKDQTYFLSGLNQYQLSKSLFPIWNYTKEQIRQIAKKANLPNADKKDSQWICFIWKVDMHNFLQKKIPQKEWNIVDTKGKILWKHKWAWFYTIWQRKWLNLWWGPARFVIKKDIKNNKLIVWTKENNELYSKELITTNRHWINKDFKTPSEGTAKIRHWQTDQNATIELIEKNRMKVNFETSQKAIASWQTVAFYKWEELVGSGTIE